MKGSKIYSCPKLFSRKAQHGWPLANRAEPVWCAVPHSLGQAGSDLASNLATELASQPDILQHALSTLYKHIVKARVQVSACTL